MQQKRDVRIIKRARAAAEESCDAAGSRRVADREREVRTVVSGWVREHTRRSEEFRREYATTLREYGFNPLPSLARR